MQTTVSTFFTPLGGVNMRMGLQSLPFSILLVTKSTKLSKCAKFAVTLMPENVVAFQTYILADSSNHNSQMLNVGFKVIMVWSVSFSKAPSSLRVAYSCVMALCGRS